MSVIAKFIYEVQPGRMGEFMEKLAMAAQPQFASPVMPKSFRLFRSTVPGPDTGHVVMLIEYEDMAAYGARTAFEDGNAEWKRLFALQPDSPERLVSVELLTEFFPKVSPNNTLNRKLARTTVSKAFRCRALSG